MDGRPLTFHLAGINNQNFLMRDDETGSYWQQISGKAISGPLAGRTLPFVRSDELSFATWRAEQPRGLVLAPVAANASEYEAKDWDRKMDKVPVVLTFRNTPLKMRDQVFGIAIGSASRAFPVAKVIADKVVLDRVGDQPVVLVTAADAQSVRAFANLSPARVFYYLTSGPALLTDNQGAHWNFQGCAVDGPDKGSCLAPVTMVKDYWFDWKNYHPDTTVFAR